MHTRPLKVGQEFELDESVEAVVLDNELQAGGHLLLVRKDEPIETLPPGLRLIVLAAEWFAVHWRVRGLMPCGRELVFLQYIHQSVDTPEDWLLKVREVRWPAPTLEMLKLHVRCLLEQEFMQPNYPRYGFEGWTSERYLHWALEELRRCGIDSPEAALQERGYELGE